jgi:hypothetical protein
MKEPLVASIALASLVLAGCPHKIPQTAMLSAPAPALKAHRCRSENGLPDPTCTPGAVRTRDVKSICHGGSERQFRPPTSYTDALKRQQLAAYGYADTDPSHYEEDHLIPLGIGGDGTNRKNLWPEPHGGNDNSSDKDRVESWLRRQVCSGVMNPNDAQRGIATDWRQYLPQVKEVAAKRRGRPG